LGAFNSKSFATTISPWVVSKDALEPFRVKGIENETKLQSYLQERTTENVYDIKLEAVVKGKLRGQIHFDECRTNIDHLSSEW
jgi:fumarylacetoacetase